MDWTSSSVGVGGLARLARRALAEWQEFRGAQVEELERCEDCGDLRGFVDPLERQMAEQWRESTSGWQPPPLGPGGRGTGWVWDSGGVRRVHPGGQATGWQGVRDEDL